MKRIFILLLFLGIFVPLKAQFKLNTNPENPNRMPDWRTEIGIVLEKNSPTITIRGANGKQSTSFLPAGILVIVDKETGYAKWVAICGNEVLSKNWKPKGKIISFTSQESYKIACEDMLDRLNTIQKGINELLDRPSNNSNYSLTELKIMFEKTLKDKFPNKREDPTFRTGGKIFVPLGCALAGGLIGGFGFPKETTTQTIVPGIKVQTGDGTFRFGPEKVTSDTKKEFNWIGFAVGATSGFIFGYLLNEVIF